MAANTLSTVLAASTTVILVLVLGRVLPVAEFARYAAAYALASLLSLIADAGIGLQLFERDVPGSEDRASRILKVRLCAVGLALIIGLLVQVLLGGSIASWFGVWLLMGGLVGYATALTFEQWRSNFKSFRRLQFLNAALYLLTATMAASRLVQSATVMVGFLGLGLWGISGNTLLHVPLGGRSTAKAAAKLAHFWPFAVSTWSSAATTQAPLLLIAHFGKAAEVGMYAIADRTLGAVGILGATVQTVLLPHLAQRQSQLREAVKVALIGLPIALIIGISLGFADHSVLSWFLPPNRVGTVLFLGIIGIAVSLSLMVVPVASEVLVSGSIKGQAACATIQALIIVLLVPLAAGHGTVTVGLSVLAGRIAYYVSLLIVARKLVLRARVTTGSAT